ncbi:MAG: peptide-methionine (S)-S-oxide reductase [Candidatus Endobugula sp.]|jgi:peptide-methionine (S)-S-oxide reductase
MMRYILGIFSLLLTFSAYAENATVIVAGGCFWCVESDYEKYPGVLTAESGYINGATKNPTYSQVASKKTGHYEVVKITYDDSVVSLTQLVDYFWRTIDPTDAKGQFCDKGSPYKTGLFYQNLQQEKVFRESLVRLNQTKPFSEAVVTKILAAETFYIAEDYHQDFYKKSSLRYKYYRASCGRDAKIKQLWGKVASKQWHK